MSAIEWTTRTWNPLTGCTRVSAGCENCYAEQMAGRLKSMDIDQYQKAVHKPDGVEEWRWTGEITYAPHRLAKPLEWTHDSLRIFVDSMSDLFHPAVYFEYIAAVFGVMAASPEHTFQILTKRPERMREFFAWLKTEADRTSTQPGEPRSMYCANVAFQAADLPNFNVPGEPDGDCLWPLPNVWLGVSCEDQQAADERIPPLLECPAAVRFVSAEPLLGPLELWPYMEARFPDGSRGLNGRASSTKSHATRKIDWIIVGGESGPGARPMHPDWPRSIRDQCASAGVAYFFKQWGAWLPISDAGPEQSGAESGWIYRDGSTKADPDRDELPLTTFRVGKKAAGRKLDGEDHDKFPEGAGGGDSQPGDPRPVGACPDCGAEPGFNIDCETCGEQGGGWFE